MSASGINTGWKRDYFIRARICPCDPTKGESCRLCDGTAADERERPRILCDATLRHAHGTATCMRSAPHEGDHSGACGSCGEDGDDVTLKWVERHEVWEI